MHCQICDEDYTDPSFGGPGICPSCDCGIPAKEKKLQRRVNELLGELVALRKDRERLDWLEAHRADMTSGWSLGKFTGWGIALPPSYEMCGKGMTIRDAIDSTRREAPTDG